MLTAILIGNLAVILGLAAALVKLTTDASARQDERDALVLDTMKVVVATILNPYGETDTTPTPDAQPTPNTESDEPQFDYDMTDTLIGYMPPPLPHAIVPAGYDPLPGADNTPEAIAERRAYAPPGYVGEA
jgi:hypothetical protein